MDDIWNLRTVGATVRSLYYCLSSCKLYIILAQINPLQFFADLASQIKLSSSYGVWIIDEQMQQVQSQFAGRCCSNLCTLRSSGGEGGRGGGGSLRGTRTTRKLQKRASGLPFHASQPATDLGYLEDTDILGSTHNLLVFRAK